MGIRRRTRVLVVDDAPAVAGIVGASLEHAGFTVRTVTSPAEALALIRQHPEAVDVLLSDVVMPGMGGLELADRAREILPQLPVVLMSDLTPIVTWSGCMVVNPLSIAAIVAMIERATSGQRKQPERAEGSERRLPKYPA